MSTPAALPTVPPAVLVLGATGRFGVAAVRAFAAAGWQVLAQRRHRSSRAAPVTVQGVQWIECELAQLGQAVARQNAVQVVVHAMNPSAYTASAWRAEAPGMMAAAIEAARALDALLLFPGNVYSFGASMPSLLREDTPQRPSTVKGRIRMALEQDLARAHATTGVRSVVIRAGDFFGSGSGSMLDRLMAKSLRRGRVGLPGDLDSATPWAYLPDLAQAFVRVAGQRDAVRDAEVLHFAGHSLSGRDWLRLLEPLAREAGWLAPDAFLKPASLPWPLLRVGGLVLPTWASLAEMRYLWTTPHALDNTRLVARIGAEPHTPAAQAVRASLADLGLLPPIAPQGGSLLSKVAAAE